MMRYFNVENNKITYNAIAQNYANIAIREIAPKYFIDNFLNSLNGKDILDVCCGTGQIAKYIVSEGFNVLGIDNSKNMITLAKQLVEKCKFKIADALEFKTDFKYDGVLAHECLSNFTYSQARKLIENIFYALKDDGKALISFSEGEGERFERLDPELPLRLFIKKYTVREVNEILDGYFKISGMWVVNEMEKERQVGRKFYLLLTKAPSFEQNPID